jgi:protoporphyrinogen/coproporphyrinogen III oxidase
VLGGLLRARFGDELTDRLVDPLLGGVYAGRVDALGLRPTMPALAAALDAGAPSLTAAADTATGGSNGGGSNGTVSRASQHGESADPTQRDRISGTPTPVFGALRGGYRVLLDALADAAHADIRLGTTVRGIERSAAAWLLVLGPANAPEAFEADAVVLAVPAPAVARLLGPIAPSAAAAAAGVELASSVVVAMAFQGQDVPVVPTSGALIAAGEPLAIKGVTHSTTKWPHLHGDGLVRMRASLGRFGEATALQTDDATLVAQVRADLATLDGITAAPVAVHVQRWGGGLPQYAVGHVARIAALEDGLPDGVAVAGAALHGVGVPACIATGRAAADRLARRVVRIA